MTEQKTKAMSANNTSSNTLSRGYKLVFSPKNAKEFNKTSKSGKPQEKVQKETTQKSYTEMIKKLWESTGISKKTHDYEALINYGRD